MTTKMDKCNVWNKIDWKTVEIQVFKIQKRIYKASLRGDIQAVHRLQRLLTSSYYGKLLAIRRTTQDNQGKKTAGVDGKKALTGAKRLELLSSMTIKGKAKPLRRVWIPKPDGTQRGLGIPTIKDRATQALVLVLTDFVVNQFSVIFDHSLSWQSTNCSASCHDSESH